MIESLFALRKANFKGHTAVRAELDLVEPEDQTTHEISFCDPIDPEFDKDIFKVNPKFIEEEENYEDIKKTILVDESDDGVEPVDESSSEEDEEEQMSIRDDTGTDSVNLRKTIYFLVSVGVYLVIILVISIELLFLSNICSSILVSSTIANNQTI